ncbi:FecR family protein [Mucilaginibacter sp. X4EP1]|uniref:FecR family protein n=1 Tax=Mucilaginibacter sp. X4EP1 TaxID=2723092 RepID=UPI00216998F3|nr:FecR family protein [Mucilaginibacter sp. X4EP1]MCS3816032.1 ferric-dicitrate binding protein FerR (iron transport regulator) [Mucilaginibacter sp. X4EP1]
MEKLIPVELLERYINGECTEAEIALVKKWYQSFEYDDDHVSGMSLSEEKELEERIYNHILLKIGHPVTEEVIVTQKPYSILRKWYTITAAAAVLVFAMMLVLYKNQESKMMLAADADASQLVSVTNNSGQIYKVILPDNSAVWLSPNSKLSYPGIFGSKSRNVSISGECFFEVTKNPQHPFIINSRSIITKVWGTSFLVNDNDKSNMAEVSVLTGKVSVSVKKSKNGKQISTSLEKDEVMLYPHQKVIYMVGEQVLKPEVKVEEPELQIWKRVDLSFENKQLREIVPVLNAKFHSHIKIANDRLNRYILNADMAGFNLPDVLEALKKSLNINYEIKNNSIDLE